MGTLISQAWNGLLRHLQCLKSSAGNPLAVEKGPGSFAPLRAELWPFKEGTRQKRTKSDAKVANFVNPFSNAHFSGLSGVFQKFKSPRSSVWHWLAIEKGSRSIAPQGAKLWPFKEGNRLRNFSKFSENRSSVFKHSFLRPGVEFCKNLKPRTIRMKCSCHGTVTQDSGTSGRQATSSQ